MEVPGVPASGNPGIGGMRILFVSHSFPLPEAPLSNLGGMQRLAVEQARALAGHPDVQLVPLVLESSSRWTGTLTGIFLARILRRIPAIVRQQRIDVVFFSSMVTAALAPLLHRPLRGTGVAMVATPVGRDVTLPNALHQWWVSRVLGSLDRVLPISRATAAECVMRGAEEDRIQVVPCAVDVHRFPAVSDRPSARAALLREIEATGGAPLPEDALLLCSVGRHQERKGFHWFIDSVMPETAGNVVYLLGGSGPMTPKIRRIVEERGLQDRVRLLGRVTETMLARLFRGTDLFVMPNVPVRGDIEGFGVVMLEAGLCGLPIIASDLEGIRDVVRTGENGKLLPAADAHAFTTAIEGIRQDRTGLAKLSLEAARFTAATFSWDVVVEQYMDALRTLVRETNELATR